MSGKRGKLFGKKQFSKKGTGQHIMTNAQLKQFMESKDFLRPSDKGCNGASTSGLCVQEDKGQTE